jgi:hypothetical protein
MLASTDYVGLATLISALGAVLIGLLTAYWNRPSHRQIDEVHAAVTTPPDSPPLGVTAAETNAKVQKVLNGGGVTPGGETSPHTV